MTATSKVANQFPYIFFLKKKNMPSNFIFYYYFPAKNKEKTS